MSTVTDGVPTCTCPVCGRAFTRPPNAPHKARCSPKCTHAWHLVARQRGVTALDAMGAEDLAVVFAEYRQVAP